MCSAIDTTVTTAPVAVDVCRNYGCSLLAQYEAVDYGCEQVLWLYGEDHKITEAGTMNIFLHWINEDGGQSPAEPDPQSLEVEDLDVHIFLSWALYNCQISKLY